MKHKDDLFSKCSKFYGDFENALKLEENLDGFEDTRVSAKCSNFCQSWQEYMWLAVNVLKSATKVSDPPKRHDTQFNLFNINGKLS